MDVPYLCPSPPPCLTVDHGAPVSIERRYCFGARADTGQSPQEASACLFRPENGLQTETAPCGSDRSGPVCAAAAAEIEATVSLLPELPGIAHLRAVRARCPGRREAHRDVERPSVCL